MIPIKNIIIINDFNYSQGGASKVAIDTANMLVEKGFNCIFVSAVSDETKSTLLNNVIQYRFNGQEFLHYNNKFLGMLNGLKCKKFTRFIENVLNNYNSKDTIVHIHGWTKACSSDFFNVLKKRKYRTFLTLHEYFSFCPNGAYFNYKKGKACKKKGCSIECFFSNCDSRNYTFKLYRYIRQLIYKKDIDFNYVQAIYISEFSKKIINKQINIPHYKVIENPFKTLKNVQKKEYDYIYIGRTSKEKGIDIFIQLAKKMPTKIFLLVGNYNIKLKNLIVTGWVSEAQVDEFLAKSRVLIFPSLWPETFGLNVIKALSGGIICIVSSNTAAEDYVIDGVNGYIFEQGSLESLENAVNKIETININNKIECKNKNLYVLNLINECYLKEDDNGIS